MGGKKKKLEGREMWKKKRGLDQKDRGRKEGGRKAPCVSKNEAKYKVKEIKLKQEIVTPPV